MMDLNLLYVFEALSQELNVTRAAARVGLTQSAMSNALKRLREAIGDPLFTRSPKGMVSTPRAKELERPVAEALALIRAMLEKQKVFSPGTSKRKFTIATTDFVELVLMPKLCMAVSKQAPLVRLEVLSLKEQVPFQDLKEGRVDVALGHFTDLEGDLFQKELYSEEFVCVCNQASPLKEKISIAAFAELKHLIVSPWGGLAGLVDSLLAQEKKTRNVVVSTPHFLVAPAIVENTDYAVTLPRRLAENLAEQYKLRILKHPLNLPKLQIRMLWHERTHKDTASSWLRTLIASSVAGL